MVGVKSSLTNLDPVTQLEMPVKTLSLPWMEMSIVERNAAVTLNCKFDSIEYLLLLTFIYFSQTLI